MRPPKSFISQPIRSLQTMLRVLSMHDGTDCTLIPDGIYGPETLQTVSAFQRSHGIPVTGITDQPTWEAIVAAYEPALVEQTKAHPVTVVWNPGQTLRPGDSHPLLPVIQGMLLVLSRAYKSVGEPGITGVLDGPTADALSSFQSLSGLPMTGAADRMTWKHLALHYPLATVLQRTPSDSGRSRS